jgi:uncharacterized protein
MASDNNRPDNGPAALVIRHTVDEGDEAFYEDWTRRIFEAVSASPGYLGRDVLKPHAAGEPYTVIVRFSSQAGLQRWLDSDERKAFIRELEGAIGAEDHYEVRAGIDVWFAPQGPKRPKAYKQFLITLAAIYPLTLIVPQVLGPMWSGIPFFENLFVGNFIVAVVIVGLMTYVIMPNVTRLLHKWLFGSGRS